MLDKKKTRLYPKLSSKFDNIKIHILVKLLNYSKCPSVFQSVNKRHFKVSLFSSCFHPSFIIFKKITLPVGTSMLLKDQENPSCDFLQLPPKNHGVGTVKKVSGRKIVD